jgi:hypothetical protein
VEELPIILNQIARMREEKKKERKKELLLMDLNHRQRELRL